MPRRRKHTTAGFATELGLAGIHTFATLYYRLPMCAVAVASAGKPHAEFGRMTGEKAAAMFEGVWDAQIEALRLAGDAATGRLRLSDLAEAPSRIAAAGLRPAFRRVKANSKRLHSRGSRS